MFHGPDDALNGGGIILGQVSPHNEPVLVVNPNMEDYDNWTLFLVRLD